MKYLEKKVFKVVSGSQKVKIEPKELPNGNTILTFFAVELLNSATYFSTFANVNQSETNVCNFFQQIFRIF